MDEQLKARAEAFLADYGELVEKHQIDFIHYPIWQPVGEKGEWKTVIQSVPVDTTQQAVKSPFIPTN